MARRIRTRRATGLNGDRKDHRREPAVPGQLDAINASCTPRDDYSPAAYWAGGQLLVVVVVFGIRSCKRDQAPRPCVSTGQLSAPLSVLRNPSEGAQDGRMVIKAMDVFVSDWGVDFGDYEHRRRW